MWRACQWLPRWERKKGGAGKGDWEVQTIMYGISKLQGCVLQHGVYHQHFVVTVGGTQPLKVVNCCDVHLELTQSYVSTIHQKKTKNPIYVHNKTKPNKQKISVSSGPSAVSQVQQSYPLNACVFTQKNFWALSWCLLASFLPPPQTRRRNMKGFQHSPVKLLTGRPCHQKQCPSPRPLQESIPFINKFIAPFLEDS